MGDNSETNNASDDPKLINELEEKYIFCSNISRWISNSNKTFFESRLAACGFVSYKLIGKCHLPPCSFPFIELSQNEDALKIINAAEESGISDNGKKEKSITGKGEKEEEEEITGPALIDKLGVDCLIEIFSHLPPSERLIVEDVCIHWRDVSKKSWCNIRELHVCSCIAYLYVLHFARSKFVEKLLMKCGVYLRNLKLRTVCSSHIIPVIGEYCHNLTKIHLKFTQSEAEHYLALSKLKNLQSFTLKSSISSECLINCLLNLPKTIKTIHIGFTGIIHIKRLSATNIFEEFTELESLTLEEFIYEKDLMEVISRKKTITDLCIGYIDYAIDLKILANLSNLERLSLRGLDPVNNYFLKCISMKCKKLKYLDVCFCQNLSDDGIRELKNLNNFKVLLINNMTDSVSDLSIGQLKGIKKLECKGCHGVKDPGIMQLIENCPDLEELNVMGTSISEETLKFAISVTRDRKNGIILSLTADLEKLKFDYQSEDYSPFLKINGPSKERNRHHLECEHHDYDYEEYDKYRCFSDNSCGPS